MSDQGLELEREKGAGGEGVKAGEKPSWTEGHSELDPEPYKLLTFS